MTSLKNHHFKKTQMTVCLVTLVFLHTPLRKKSKSFIGQITTVDQIVHLVHRLVVCHFDLVAQLREGLHGDGSIHVGPVACVHF